MKTSGYSEMYDAYYYAHGCGRVYQRDEEWLNFFDTIAGRIVSDIEPRTVLDAGCAMGFLVECLQQRGVEAFGVDVSEYAIQQVHPDIRPHCWVGSMIDPFPRKYDLIVCIEVLEHLPERETELAIDNLCQHSDDILFSSTPLDYKEATHFNVQPPEYWAELFARQGFFRDADFDASFITPWAARFRKVEEPVPRLVRAYERRFWHLLQENQARRQVNFEQRNELARKDEVERVLRDEAKILKSRLETMRGQAETMRSQAKSQAEAMSRRIESLEQTVQFLEGQVRVWQELQTTMGWTVLQSLQRLRARLTPPNSRREKLLLSTFDALQIWRQEGFRALPRRISEHRESVSDTGTETVQLPLLNIPRSSPQWANVEQPTDNLRLALYTKDIWTSACVILRFMGPARYPSSGIQVLMGVDWESGSSLVLPEDADAVVIQRDFLRHRGLYQQVVDWARSEGKPVVYELDDLLLELPDGHPEKAYFDEIQDLIRQVVVNADAVVASTLDLVEYMRVLNPNAWLLPNYLDDQLWTMKTRPEDRKPGSVVIGYMGGVTKTHLPDLELVAPVLMRLLEKYKDRVRLRFWGVISPELVGLPNVEFVQETLPDYRAFARYFSEQDIDIFIAPLRNSLFNRCKSRIKFLEYSALGAPGIYSRIAPYERVVAHGKNGFLASSPQEWESYLKLLIEDHGLRYSMGKAAQDTVKRMLLSDHAHEWGTIYRAALASAESTDWTATRTMAGYSS